MATGDIQVNIRCSTWRFTLVLWALRVSLFLRVPVAVRLAHWLIARIEAGGRLFRFLIRSRIVASLLVFLLLASPALAQVQNPARPDLREEGVSQGRIFALNCVGVELLCAVTGGVGSITFSGASLLPPTTDTTAIVKGSADPTKTLFFEVDGFTAPRTMTPPNSNGTLAVLGLAQSWSATQTFAGSVIIPDDQGVFFGVVSTSFPALRVRTEQVPDAPVIGTGTTANYWIFGENADAGFNRAIPQQTNPPLCFVPAAQDTTQRQCVAHYGSHGRAIKTLTGGAATAVVQIPVAVGAVVGGTIDFTVFAADATDFQAFKATLQYAATNKAGTENCPVPTVVGAGINAGAVGTLTCTYTCSTAPTNAVNIEFNCVSSLTETTLEAWYQVTALGASEPLPQ